MRAVSPSSARFKITYRRASLFAIAASRRDPRLRTRRLPAYTEPEQRRSPTLVLGETHFETTTGRAPAPTWLTIPQRGLYTGVMVLGAVGTGKTSACMYPYTEQLLRWRAKDAEHKIGGLVLEVLASPGHTDDSISLKVEDALLTVDALLIRGAGRGLRPRHAHSLQRAGMAA